MDVWGKLLVGGAVVFAGYEIFRAVAIQRMTFSLVGISATQSGEVTTVTGKIQVVNPTIYSNTLQSVSGSLYANGNYLGNAYSAEAATIGPNSTSFIPFELQISDLGLITIILSIVAGNVSQATVEFKGTVTIDWLTFPVDLTYQVL